MTDATYGLPPALSSGEAPAPVEAQSSDDDTGPDTHLETERDAIDYEAFRRGDEECFRAVLDRYGNLIQRVVWSYADSDDEREDLYQEVCIRILEQRHKYREVGSMAAWVSTVARRVALNWRASSSARESLNERYATSTVPIEAAGSLIADPSRLLNFKDFLARVERVLNAIPKRQAEAFRMVQLDGYSPKEAARILGVETATVRSNLRHARNRLRQELMEVKDELS